MINDSGMVKIGDLGIARMSESGSKVSQKDGVSGSPHYISPEQARGEDIDSGADMYSLGVTLYHMLAGRPPFVGSNARELVLKHVRETPPELSRFRADLPPMVTELVAHLMEKDRGKRPSSLIEMCLLTARHPEAAATGSSGRRRALLAGGVILLLIALGAGIGILLDEAQRRGVREAEELARVERLRADLERNIGEMARHRRGAPGAPRQPRRRPGRHRETQPRRRGARQARRDRAEHRGAPRRAGPGGAAPRARVAGGQVPRHAGRGSSPRHASSPAAIAAPRRSSPASKASSRPCSISIRRPSARRWRRRASTSTTTSAWSGRRKAAWSSTGSSRA
jgi:hypothetical protein